MIPSLLGSVVLGLVKGLTAPAPIDFSWEQDLVGPVREEALFRGPLYFFPKVPFGSTAVVFTAAHLDDDVASGVQMTPAELLARLGDVFLGSLLYESAMRKSGIVSAIAAHAAHNIAIGVGSRLRR